MSDIDQYKRVVAAAAAELVPNGARVGLGTGSTVAHLLPVLARRDLNLRCAATSLATERTARELGLTVEPLDALGELDIAIDGADQVDADNWLVKGGGAAHTREKIVAAAARRFVVIIGEDKLVDRIGPPIPLEILRFGAAATLGALAPARWRDVPISPDGNLIGDYTGSVEDPGLVATWLSGTPGLVEHGLFAPQMVSDVLIGGPDGVEHRGA